MARHRTVPVETTGSRPPSLHARFAHSTLRRPTTGVPTWGGGVSGEGRLPAVRTHPERDQAEGRVVVVVEVLEVLEVDDEDEVLPELAAEPVLSSCWAWLTSDCASRTSVW